MRQELAAGEANKELVLGPVHVPGQVRTHPQTGVEAFPPEPYPGRRTDVAAGPASFGSQAFTNGQRARWTLGDMVGRSPSMERLFLQMRYLAGHLRCALIEGEAGTGKQLAARTLHALGPVRDRAFVSAPAEEFLSGAHAAAQLEQVRGGTLHLHGVDTLHHEQQGRLLQLLGWVQQQQAQGARAALTAGASVTGPRALLLSARRALRPLVLYGKFRNDLHGQISAVQLALPPLRDRRDDIPMLVEFFVSRYAESYGKRIRGVAQEALEHLLRHPWPGNVRELEIAVSRAVLRSEGDSLRARDFLLPAFVEQPDEAHAQPPALLSMQEPVQVRAVAGQGSAVRAMAPAARASLPEPLMVARPGEAMQPQTVPARVSPFARSGGQGPGMRIEMRSHAHTSGSTGAALPAHAGSMVAGRTALSPMRAVVQDAKPDGKQDGKGSFQSAVRDIPQDVLADANLDRAIMRHIQGVLRSAGGNKLRTARLLGISRSTLYRLLDAHAVAHGGRELPRE